MRNTRKGFHVCIFFLLDEVFIFFLENTSANFVVICLFSSVGVCTVLHSSVFDFILQEQHIFVMHATKKRAV